MSASKVNGTVPGNVESVCLNGGSASCRWSLLSLRGLAANPVENLRPKGAFVVRFENSRLSILALSSPTVAPVVARMLDSFRLDRSGVTDSNRTMAKPWPLLHVLYRSQR